MGEGVAAVLLLGGGRATLVLCGRRQTVWQAWGSAPCCPTRLAVFSMLLMSH